MKKVFLSLAAVAVLTVVSCKKAEEAPVEPAATEEVAPAVEEVAPATDSTAAATEAPATEAAATEAPAATTEAPAHK